MSLKFDNSLIYKVQQANDIVEVISEHLRLDRKGKEFVGICPFHEDHRPSMYVNPVKGIFKCFACGAGGDVIKFVQMRENLSFPEAIENLANRAGINFTPLKRTEQKVSSDSEIDPKVLAQINLYAARHFRSNLEEQTNGQFARDYLQKRGISEESIKKWGLGLAIDSWDNLTVKATADKMTELQLVRAGLAVKRDQDRGCYDKFRNRLIFPIIDATGKVIGFGGRTLGDDPAKYMNSPATSLFDKSTSLYGLNNARHEMVKTSTAVVVEGYTDVIMAHQNNCKNVIATLGTSLTQGHARLLRRFAKKIVLIFDSDVAGTEAANRALQVCLKQKIDIKIASVPDGKDPCDFILEHGGEAFNKIIEDAIDVMEYKWQRIKNMMQTVDNLADRKAAIEEYLDSIAAGIKGSNIDPMATDLIISRLANITGVTTDNLRNQIKRKMAAQSRTYTQVNENEQVISRDLGPEYYVKAQEHIIEVLLNKAGLYVEFKDQIDLKMFTGSLIKQVAEKVLQILEESADETLLQKAIANLESTEATAYLMRLDENGQAIVNYRQTLQDSIKAMDYHQKHNNITPGNLDDDQLRLLMENASKPDMRRNGLVF